MINVILCGGSGSGDLVKSVDQQAFLHLLKARFDVVDFENAKLDAERLLNA